MTRYDQFEPRHTWDIVKHDLPAFEADLSSLCNVARQHGATTAQIIDASDVVTDTRVTLKCKIPPCEMYGRNHMCPPFSPTAEETAKVVESYKKGILIGVDSVLPQEYWDYLQREDVPLCKIVEEQEYVVWLDKIQVSLWRTLHAAIMEVEREAHNRGYYFAVGYVASTCYLCWPGPNAPAKELNNYCPVKKPCKKPYEARPSMEAAGIDVFSTFRKAGLSLKLASKDSFSWSGLVLVV